jgi:predicted PurR-regulated permease PerM
LIIGIVQGSLGALALLIFGIKSWILWGFIMIVLSIIPVVGPWIVLIPAGLIQIFLGNIWQGIGIIIFSVIVVSNIDNFLRPRLVGQGAKLHDLVVFFSSLGGIAVFGVMGFIVGPVIASLFVSVLDIYSAEFKDQLKVMNES